MRWWLATLVLALASITVRGQSPTLTNALIVHGTHTFSSRPLVTVEGGVVCVGITFSDTITVGPFRLSSRGQRDVAVIGCSRSLEPLWIHQVGGPGDDSLVACAAGHGSVTLAVAACGLRPDLVGIGIGTTVLYGRGNYDIVTTRFDTTGSLRWARLDGGAESDVPGALAVRHDGTTVLSASYTRRSRVDTVVVEDREADVSAFLHAMDADGRTQWVRPLDGLPSDTYPRPMVVAGGWIGWQRDTIVATVGAAGVIRWGEVAAKVDNTWYETAPALVRILTDGTPVDIRPLAGCRGDSGTAAVRGDTLVTAWAEERNCQPGSEPLLVWRWTDGDIERTVNVVSGGTASRVGGLTAGPGDLLLCGTVNRTLTLDSTRTRPDVITENRRLRDGFVARLHARGTAVTSWTMGSSHQGAFTSAVPAFGTDVFAAGVLSGTVPFGGTTIGTTADTAVVLLRYGPRLTSVLDENAPLALRADTPAPFPTQVRMTAVDGRAWDVTGGDLGGVPPGLYVAAAVVDGSWWRRLVMIAP